MAETYFELKARADALFAQAEAVRAQEIGEVIAGIKAQMKQYNLTVADLGEPGMSPRKAAKSKTSAEPKYRGPSGQLWAGGLGRKPEWVRVILAEGKDIEDFRIKS